jgi:hypothetical protein
MEPWMLQLVEGRNTAAYRAEKQKEAKKERED